MRSGAWIGVLLCALSWSASAREYIESFHSDIEVRRNGDLYVSETIVVRAEGNSIRRGIYRDFPTRYRDPEGRYRIVGFEVLAVRRDGAAEPFRVEDRANGKRVYIGDARIYLEPGFYQYELDYVTTRQLGFFDEFDELYWNVTGTGWAFSIERASALLTLPAAARELRLTGYTGAQGSTAKNLTYRRVDERRAYFETSEPLPAYAGLTIVAGWAKGLVDEPNAAQRRAWFLADHKPSLIAGAGAILLFGYYLLLWRRLGRDPAGGVIVPRYRPPPGYSPASMRYVENMGYDNKCFTSAVINLAVKNAIDIEHDGGDFDLVYRGPPTPAPAPGETAIIARLFGEARSRIGIARSNHRVLAAAKRKHAASLSRDYAKKYFRTNSGWLAPGLLLTAAAVVASILALPSEELMVRAIFVAVFTLIPLIMLFAATRALLRRGKKGWIRGGINLVMLFVFGGFFFASGFPIVQLAEAVPLPMIVSVLAMFALHYAFYHWLKAPTLAGRRLLDQVEGFRHYLGVAEDDEIASLDAPTFTADLYESYLPYAIALDLENAWTARLDRAIAAGLVAPGYSHPRWYHARGGVGARGVSRALATSLDSAIASSSVAPGSSSGSSGGFSGGGGGGGGGGGW